MKNFIEILKQLLFLFFSFIYSAIKEIWEPLLTSIIKILLISGIIFCIASFVPHNILLIKDISYIGWVSIYCIIALLFYKLDNSIDIDINKNDETSLPMIDVENETIQSKQISQNEQPVEFVKDTINIKKEQYGSTRE